MTAHDDELKSPFSRMPRCPAIVPFYRVLFSLALRALLLTNMISGWPLAAAQAHAAALAGPTSPTPPTMTLQKFLSQKINDGHPHGPFHYPSTVPPIPGAIRASMPQAPLPSAEPARMQAVSLGVDNSLLSTSGLSTHGSTTGLTGNPLHVRGSDGRLEVTLAPGSLDLSHATVTGGAAPVAPFTVRVSQLHGHLIGSSSILGSYQIQILDHLGRVVQDMQLLQPATIVYHYQPWEMRDLGVDPGQIRLSWPTLLQQAHQQKPAKNASITPASTTGLVTPMTLNAQAQTLTAHTSILAAVPFDVSGDPTNQTPQKPQEASMSGNSGQLSYTYPMTVPAGPDGFGPHLQLTYSSGSPNQRYSNRSPADNVGDGWALSLGSISIQSYPSSSTSGAGTWFFLNNVAGVSDRLVPAQTSGFYETEHLSHLRIQFTGTSFRVWDRSGFYYEYGSTADSAINYSEGFGNTHGTPYVTDGNGNVTDDRLDPFYCPNNAANTATSKRCTGVYAHPEEKAWSTQLVTQIQALGQDASGTQQDPLNLATTTYHYSLATTGSDPSCTPITGTGVPPQEGQCGRDTWIPGYNSNHVSQPDGDWQDYYHSEYRGFNIIYTMAPAGDVTASYFFSTEAWYTPQTDGPNYSAGSLYQEDVYWGNELTDSLIMQRTTNQYVGTQGSSITPCNTALNATYTPCEVVMTSSKTSYTEGAGTGNANTPWVEHDYTYDDINAQGLVTTPPDYHNLLQEVISSKDAPTITKKWTYQTNDQTAGGVTYYHVDAVSHSEIDDDSGHV